MTSPAEVDWPTVRPPGSGLPPGTRDDREARPVPLLGGRHPAPPSEPPPMHPDDPGPVEPGAGGAATTQAGPARARAMVASSLPPGRPVQWLAKGWLPRSATAVLIGPEGIGKSLWWVEVAARVTTGRQFEAIGMPRRVPAAVVVVLTEDSRSEVEARLRLAGADLDRIIFVACDEDLAEPPVFPDDMPVVTDAVAEFGAVLVVVDAWLDTVDPRLSVKNPQQARQALLPWRTMANATGAAVLLVGNSNRVGGDATIRDRIGATSTLRQAARMLIYAEVESDEERGHSLWLGPDKTNTSGRQPAHRFHISVSQVREPTDDDPGMTAHLLPDGRADQTIEGLMSEWSKAEARHRRETTGEGARAGDRATAWLDQYMVPGESYPAADLQHRARAAGISESAMREAKGRLQVSSEKSASGWYWSRESNSR